MKKQILAKEIPAGKRTFTLVLEKEDLSAIYPGFLRFTLTVGLAGAPEGSAVAIFRTNTYEYAPGVQLRAEEVALEKSAEWELEIRADPDGFLEQNLPGARPAAESTRYDVVIVQGSPRAGGNSGTLAAWAEETAQGQGMSCTVLYPHELDIHECIGCYQCFNTGSCIYDDDMAGIIDAVSRCRLLVICTPVYTNTAPANLKMLIDRFQSYFAAQTLGMAVPGKTNGVILAVSGRPGQENFLCVRKELTAFFNIAGITPAGNVFIDGVDRIRDIRELPGCREKVTGLVAENLVP